MTNTHIKISPISIQISDLYLSVEYQLNQRAAIHYNLRTEQGITVKGGTISLTNEEFSAWGQDDTYIENLVLSKLNLEKAQ